MSGATPRNNVGALRIRASAPRNNTGRKMVWNGENWVLGSDIIAREKTNTFELLDKYIKSSKEYLNSYVKLQEYKLMDSSDDELMFLNQKIIRLNNEVIQDKINLENAIEHYRELSSMPITPVSQRRNRKTRKSNNRR